MLIHSKEFKNHYVTAYLYLVDKIDCYLIYSNRTELPHLEICEYEILKQLSYRLKRTIFTAQSKNEPKIRNFKMTNFEVNAIMRNCYHLIFPAFVSFFDMELLTELDRFADNSLQKKKIEV